MSKKFLISEEDRSYIIGLYGNKGIVLEQGTNAGTVSANSNADLNVINLNNKRMVLDLCKTETSKKYWNEIFADKNQKTLAASIITSVLDAQKTDPIVRVAIKKATGTTETPGKKTDTPPGPPEDNTHQINGFSFTVPPSTKTSNWFCNNKSDLSKQGIDDLNSIVINPIVEAMNSAKENAIKDLTAAGIKNPEKRVVIKGCLDSLSINTSCSRYPNTREAAGMTFLDLSNARANSVDTYIRGKLNEIGITVGCKAKALPKSTINPYGANKDGSSGPNPPTGGIPTDNGKGKSNATGDVDMNPKDRTFNGQKPLGTKPAKNSCGDDTNSDYDQFKYVQVTPTIGISPVIEEDNDQNSTSGGTRSDKKGPEVQTSQEYVVTLFTKSSSSGSGGNKLKWKMKWNLDFGKKLKVPKFGTPLKLDCYSF